MKVLVTGASGFIGKHLVRELSRLGNDMVLISRQGRAEATLQAVGLSVDVIEDPGSAAALADRLADYGVEGVAHLAAQFDGPVLVSGIDRLVESNIGFGARVAGALATIRPGMPFVNAASIWQHLGGPVFNPVSLYAATKQAFEGILVYFTVTEQLDVRTLVLPDTYGPADRRGKVVSLLIDASVNGRPLDAASGNGVLDLVHVDDIARGLIAALDPALGPGRWILSSERVLTVRELASAIGAIVGQSVPVNWGALPDPLRHMTGLTVGVPLLPDWQAEIALVDGLRQMLIERQEPLDDSQGRF